MFPTDAAGRGLGSKVVEVQRPGDLQVAVPLNAAPDEVAAVAVAFEAATGGTHSVRRPVAMGF